jgi:CubicO group peptidase (beta-lactamase class C family)
MRYRTLCAAAWIVALGLASCTSVSTEQTTPAQEARALFENIGTTSPFCTAAVLSGDKVVFAEAYGSINKKRVTPATKVDIASVSKQFTGVAVELLMDRGDLSGSDLVGELVPASSPATDDITVNELLTHTSGLPDYIELLPFEFDEATTQKQAVKVIAKSDPTDTRGSFEYSNSNYVLLAEVVNSVTGTSLPEFLAAEVFTPLDLDMSIDPRGPWKQVGDGSIWTTPTELVRWSDQYWDQTLDGPGFATVMFDPEVNASNDGDSTDDTYGSGIMRGTDDDDAEWFFHDGSWDRYETDWALIPEEQLAAAVTCDTDAKMDSDTPARDLIQLWRK